MSAKTYDAVILGGGPAGATAAILLAQAGWSVAVIEKTSFPRRKVCGEFLSATNLPLLDRLGVVQAFGDLAGPPVTQMGLFAGTSILTAEMPRPRNGADGFGRALGREHLDTLLLSRAAEVGAAVWQPCSAVGLTRTGKEYLCDVVSKESHQTAVLRARIIIAAHGSWERGSLPTQPTPRAPRPSDLLGFKAHFAKCALPPGLMPLFAFPGGYGGMVHTDRGRMSLSFCIRRDRLQRCRQIWPNGSAAEAVLAQIRESCLGVHQAMARAIRDGAWLSTGPIRPGIRCRVREGIFLVGNAAGEAHPVIAEGISMAMQSAWLLCERLVSHRDEVLSGTALGSVARDYSAAWHRAFASRIRAASIFAHWAMRPTAVSAVLPCLLSVPLLLSLCARWSGKANNVIDKTLPSRGGPRTDRSGHSELAEVAAREP